MDTEIFKKKFNSGELGDDKEWLEWEHFANVVSLLQKKLIDLETLKWKTCDLGNTYLCLSNFGSDSPRRILG